MADSASGLLVSCECGYVSFRTPSAKPVGRAYCHCTSCQKQSASAFGTSAFWPADQVFPLEPEVDARLSTYSHPTDSGNTMSCRFCPKCGVRVFNFTTLPDGTRGAAVAFKGGCVRGLDWKGVKHIWTRSAVTEIPAGAETYEKSPKILFDE